MFYRGHFKLFSDKLKLGREDVRLWKMLPAHKLVLLDETEEKALDTLGIRSSDSILIEVRRDIVVSEALGWCVHVRTDILSSEALGLRNEMS